MERACWMCSTWSLADWVECITGVPKRHSCCRGKQAMCEFMFLSNPLYLKVLISTLFHCVSISTNTTDAFCLLRNNNMILIVSDFCFLQLHLCVCVLVHSNKGAGLGRSFYNKINSFVLIKHIQVSNLVVFVFDFVFPNQGQAFLIMNKQDEELVFLSPELEVFIQLITKQTRIHNRLRHNTQACVQLKPVIPQWTSCGPLS